jgi:hypothetical protein
VNRRYQNVRHERKNIYSNDECLLISSNNSATSFACDGQLLDAACIVIRLSLLWLSPKNGLSTRSYVTRN